jgi:hypothetical protein
MSDTTLSVSDQIMRRARANGRGSIFTPSDFLDMAARAAVDQALSRLVRASKLRRLAQGLYDFPKLHAVLGPLSPSPDDVAQALARETGSQVQIAGARAANALGLSTQVTARNMYLTNGPSRRVVLGSRVVDVRHASPKHLIAPGSPAGTVIQALRHLGAVRAADVVQVAATSLSASDKKTLGNNAIHAPAWMRPTLVSIAQTSTEAANG